MDYIQYKVYVSPSICRQLWYFDCLADAEVKKAQLLELGAKAVIIDRLPPQKGSNLASGLDLSPLNLETGSQHRRSA